MNLVLVLLIVLVLVKHFMVVNFDLLFVIFVNFGVVLLGSEL